MIINMKSQSHRYKNMMNQVRYIKSEVSELEESCLDYKYEIVNDKDRIGEELLDIIQTCVTFIEEEFSPEEIKKLMLVHNEKLKPE